MKIPILRNVLFMKKIGFLFLTLFSLGIFFSACDNEDFDAPPHSEPQYSGESNITIKDFKEKYDEVLVEVTDDDIIEGVITANDISGNLYKQIFIEDETGGLMVAIDRNDIYNDFRVGQKIFIETKGLYMGKYGGMPQLGYRYSRNNDGNYSIGQMTWEQVKDKIFKDGYPDPESVVPAEIDYNDFTEDNYGRLVKLEGVYFDDSGQIFSYPDEEGDVQTLNRVIRFAANESQTVTARMSSAADFASDTIPSGVGTVTGILTVYSGTVQLLVREKEDMVFEANPDGWGLEDSPWSVQYALANVDQEKVGWVKGYIVGAVADGINEDNPITDNEGIAFEAPFLPNYIVIADSPDESNWENCLVVNLPAGSDMRELVNLSDNADLLGEEIRVYGTIETILGAGGVRIANGTVDEFRIGNIGLEILRASFATSLEPFTEYSVSGDQKWIWDSYGYAKMTGYDGGTDYANEDWLISPAIDLSGYDAANISFEHVSRYSNNNKEDFTLWISSDYTGGDPSSATWTQIVIANYSSGTSWDDWTSTGNLNIPEEFMGKANVFVALKYLSTSSKAGTWEVRNLVIKSGAGETIDDDEPDMTPEGDGSRENPYNIAAVIQNQGVSTESVWSYGYIVGAINGYSISDAIFEAPFGEANTNLLIAASPDETDPNNCIPVQLPNNSVRPVLNLVDNPDNLGKMVLVFGTLETYFNVPGIKSVSNYVLDGQSGDPDVPDDAILSASFLTTLEPFTAYSVSGDQSWVWDTYGYAKMTGYVSGTYNANEDWLISPAFDLSGYDAANISFQHLSRFGNNTEDFTLWISSDYTGGDPSAATWTQIVIANYSSGSSWDDWTSSGNLNIPEEFMGKANVYIALKYLSTSSQAGTWEVRNLLILPGTGEEIGGGDEPGDTEETPQGDGTQENPYNIAAVIENQDATTEKVWSSGYIVGVLNGSASNAVFEEPFGDVTTNLLIAASPDETDPNNCVPVQLPNNDVRPVLNLADNPDNHGKLVLLYGTLEAYFGLPGIKNVTNYVLDGQSLDDGTDDTPDGTIILEASFASTLSPFTAFSVTGEQTWDIDTGYECAKMSGYSGGAVPNEDWLISSTLDLSSYTAPYIVFEHAINHADDLSTFTLLISDDYNGGDPSSATWEALTIPKMPDGDSWDFVESGNISIPAEYLVDGVTIAFKYVSTDEDAGTWEIKNLFVVE